MRSLFDRVVGFPSERLGAAHAFPLSTLLSLGSLICTISDQILVWLRAALASESATDNARTPPRIIGELTRCFAGYTPLRAPVAPPLELPAVSQTTFGR